MLDSLNLTTRPANPESNTVPRAPVPESASIGASLVIKGEIIGMEPLFIDGAVEGSISLPNHRVTVSRGSKVDADINAHDVVVLGSVNGDILCADLLDVRSESSIAGEVVTRRIRVEDGAVLKGRVEVHVPKPVGAKAEDPDQLEPTASASPSGSGKHLRGSSTLLEPIPDAEPRAKAAAAAKN